LAGTWHNKIVQILDELCQEDVKNGIYSKVHNNKPIDSPISYMKQVVWYQPDLYAIRKKEEKIDVFEVIDTQSEGEAVEDMVLSALTPRVSSLCIVCSDSEYLEKIKKKAIVILHKIYDEDKKSYASIFNPKYFMHVPKNTRFTKPRSVARIKSMLRQQLEFGTR